MEDLVTVLVVQWWRCGGGEVVASWRVGGILMRFESGESEAGLFLMWVVFVMMDEVIGVRGAM